MRVSMTNRSVYTMEILLKEFQTCVTKDLSAYAGSLCPKGEAARAMRENILKKITIDGEDASSANSAALEKFFQAQRRCSGYQPLGSHDDDVVRRCYGRMRGRLNIALGSFSSLSASWHKYYDLGPGASRGSRSNDIFSKLTHLSSTSGRLASLYYGHLSESHLAAHKGQRDFLKVAGSTLSFVPKTRKISRVICTEPSLNMMAQKVIDARLRQVLVSAFGIDLATQPNQNKRFARLGSRIGHVSTIDLESASDSISLGLIRDLMPVGFESLLLWTRSPRCKLPDGRSVDFKMVSSMGNGFTFPLQTIIFAAAVMAAYDEVGLHYRAGKNRRFCVFGDDIIVSTRAFSLVVKLLDRMGFVTNKDKTFHTGPFRESCGGDYWCGHDVRAVYIKSLDCHQDYVSAFNRIRMWSSRHSIPMFRSLLWLRRKMGSLRKRIPVVPFGSPVTDGLWGTRRQALARGCKSVGFGLLAYNCYRAKTAAPRLKYSAQDADLLLRCCSSGRMLADSRGHPLTGEKKPLVRWHIASSVSSVWPDSHADTLVESVLILKRSRQLAALTSQAWL